MSRRAPHAAGHAIAARKYDATAARLAYAAGYRDGWNDEVIDAVMDISPAYAQGVQDAREDRAAARANLECEY